MICFILTTTCKLEKKRPLRTILCIGSGGHTSELIRLFKAFSIEKYQPRLYIIAKNDTNSEVKIHELEKYIGNGLFTIQSIPRSRNVHQSYLSSIKSTLNAILYSVHIVYNFGPDVVLCNGPGTCVPICVVSFLLRCMFLLDCRIVFIESICRVRTLSLTGKILQYFADVVVVQWPQLRDACFRAKYFGRLT